MPSIPLSSVFLSGAELLANSSADAHASRLCGHLVLSEIEPVGGGVGGALASPRCSTCRDCGIVGSCLQAGQTQFVAASTAEPS